MCNLLPNKTHDSISSQSPRSLEHLVNCKCIPLTGKSAIPSLRNGLEELTSACDKAIFLLNAFYHLSSRTYLPLMTALDSSKKPGLHYFPEVLKNGEPAVL